MVAQAIKPTVPRYAFSLTEYMTIPLTQRKGPLAKPSPSSSPPPRPPWSSPTCARSWRGTAASWTSGSRSTTRPRARRRGERCTPRRERAGRIPGRVRLTCWGGDYTTEKADDAFSLWVIGILGCLKALWIGRIGVSDIRLLARWLVRRTAIDYARQAGDRCRKASLELWKQIYFVNILELSLIWLKC